MGFVYVIRNNHNDMIYVGQTSRNVQIRWKEHRVKAKDRYLNNAIKEFGVDKFEFILVKELPNDSLDKEEKELIYSYNSIYPNGYNICIGRSSWTITQSKKGGSSDIGHDKHSLAMKQRYKELDHLKDLGDIPRGISYWEGIKKGRELHGFKVRKIGIKNKEFISTKNKDNLSYDLDRAKKYLNDALNQSE